MLIIEVFTEVGAESSDVARNHFLEKVGKVDARGGHQHVEAVIAHAVVGEVSTAGVGDEGLDRNVCEEIRQILDPHSPAGHGGRRGRNTLTTPRMVEPTDTLKECR